MVGTVLPFANDRWPLVRVLTATAANAASWVKQSMWSKRRRGYGMELLSCSRVALPAVGEAKIRYHFGRIDADLVGVLGSGTAASLSAGNGFSSSSNTVSAPDLRGHEIRIQMAPWVDDSSTPAWRTVWWGQCEYQEDLMRPGEANPSGERVYHCVDGFARTRRWMMNRHGVYVAGTSYDNVRGHPGYNVGPDGGISGNRVTGSTSYLPAPDCDNKTYCHTWQGSTNATTWNDRQAVEHALRITRPVNEPLFNLTPYDFGSHTLDGGLDWLINGVTAWTVNEAESAFDFVGRVCRRQRGRGLVFVDWADDSGAPDGALSPKLTIAPLVLSDVPYTPPGGSLVTLQGATNAGSTVAVDLIGDHRSDASSFQLGDRDQHRYDAVESLGERIETVVTLSKYDTTSLEDRFDASAITAFTALTATKRMDEAWKYVYSLFGLPRAFQFLVKDHNGGTQHRCDYRCDDTGAIVMPTGTQDTSPVLTEVLTDLPLLEGYDYSVAAGVAPTRRGGGTETGVAPRRPPFIAIRTASDRYLSGDELDSGQRPVTLQVSKDGILVYAPGDNKQTTGATRVIGNTATSGLGSVYNTSQLGITVALRTPHRVRMWDASYINGSSGVKWSPSNAKRTLSIYHQGVHLWVLDYGALWDLDTSGKNASGSAGRRGGIGAVSGAPGLIRDDRPALAALHAMACAWYLNHRRTVSWSQKAFGLLPTFDKVTDTASQTTTAQAYPKLGQMVTTMTASGQVHTINTPITAVSYDHQQGVTSWATDWCELDFT